MHKLKKMLTTRPKNPPRSNRLKKLLLQKKLLKKIPMSLRAKKVLTTMPLIALRSITTWLKSLNVVATKSESPQPRSLSPVALPSA